jgi:hypothetical protein
VKAPKVTQTTVRNGTRTVRTRKIEDVVADGSGNQSLSEESEEDVLEENAAVMAVPETEDGYIQACFGN